MEWFDLGDVYKFNVIANLELDGVPSFGEDFVWALVIQVERRFNQIYTNIYPA